MFNDGSWFLIAAIVIFLVTSVGIACFYAIFEIQNRTMQAQLDLSDEQLARLLPRDADKSHLNKQRKAMQKSLYFTKESIIKPLPAESDVAMLWRKF
jgi:hypothetical protein